MNMLHLPCAKTAIGFTLIETLVTMAVLGILLTLAAPSFRSIQLRWEVHSAARALESSLIFARSEAIRRAGKVALHQADACPSKDWSCGWIVFADQDGDGVKAASEAVLQTTDLAGSVKVVNSTDAAFLRFDRYGAVTGANSFSFSFTPTQAPDGSQRMLCISQGWRIRALDGSSCA